MRLSLDIELRDIHQDPNWNAELLSMGGNGQVPCLRIDQGDDPAQWLYESEDIVHFLEQKFPAE